MTLTTRLAELIRACFTGIWIESHEQEDALTEIAQLCRDESWRLATWNIETGLTVNTAQQAAETTGGDPLAAIRALRSLATANGTTLLVLQNFHRFLQSTEILQALAHQIAEGKQHRTFVLIVSPVLMIPIELEKLFVVVEHELPDRGQLAEIARGIATEQNELPTGIEYEQLLDSAAGLTRYEAEAAFSLSLVRHGKLRADVLWEQKAQLLKNMANSACTAAGNGSLTWVAWRTSRRFANGPCDDKRTPSCGHGGSCCYLRPAVENPSLPSRWGMKRTAPRCHSISGVCWGVWSGSPNGI